MDIHKVNATLSKALGHIREGENADLHSQIVEDEMAEDGGDVVSDYFETLATQVSEASGIDYEAAHTLVMEVAETLAEKTPAIVEDEADIDEWAAHVGLAEAIAAKIN